MRLLAPLLSKERLGEVLWCQPTPLSPPLATGDEKRQSLFGNGTSMRIGIFSNLVVRFRSDPRFQSEMLVLASMYLGYAALYMCRATIVISGPALLDDPRLGLNKTAWGAIIGWGTAGTLIGKLANGVLADKLGGRRVFMLSLGFCMLATGIFGTMSGVLYFSLAYFIALFAKSAAWHATRRFYQFALACSTQPHRDRVPARHFDLI